MSNNLTPAQVERLVKLQEEMNEAGKELCKILLHGFHATGPNGVTYDNETALSKELGDVRSAIRLLVDCGDLNGRTIYLAQADKDQCITRYMHHQDGSEADWLRNTAWDLFCCEDANRYDCWEDVPAELQSLYMERAIKLARVCKGEKNA